jgi:hypothetical protein
LLKIEEAVSQEAGGKLLLEASAELTDGIAAALWARAEAMRAANDADGFEEYKALAELTRSLVTLRQIRSTDPETPEHASQILASNRNQFDDAFIQLLVRICSNCIHDILKALEQIKAGDSSAVDAAQKATEKSKFEAGFLQAVADASQNPSHQAQAQMVSGMFLLVLAQPEEALDKDASAIREQVRFTLTRCAENKSAPADLRARAEGNLAAVAGEAHLALVDKHQAAAQQLAEQAGDMDALRTTRRDRAFWAKKRRDWRAAYDLYRQNIEDTERALWKELSLTVAFGLVSTTSPDYEAIVETCLELAKEDPSYYQRALEFADQDKARAFLRTTQHSKSSGGFRGESKNSTGDNETF